MNQYLFSKKFAKVLDLYIFLCVYSYMINNKNTNHLRQGVK